MKVAGTEYGRGVPPVRAEPKRAVPHDGSTVCLLGLRISECLGLRWSDVDWLNGKLRVERGIVCQQVDEVKTAESRRADIRTTMNVYGDAAASIRARRRFRYGRKCL